MTWNYRVVEIQPDLEQENKSTPCYGFITAWYSKSGELDSWSEPPAAPYGYTLDQLQGDVSYFKRALEKDLLSNSTFDVKFGLPCTEVPVLVIHRTTYPARNTEPSDEPPEEDFRFMVIKNGSVEEPFVPIADSIDLLRRIIEEMEKVIANQQALPT